MKTELTIISDDLNHGIIDEKQARNLLLDLLGVSGSAFTKEDLKKAYNNGSRQGSVNGMRVARGGEMNVTTFDEWYDQHYR